MGSRRGGASMVAANCSSPRALAASGRGNGIPGVLVALPILPPAPLGDRPRVGLFIPAPNPLAEVGAIKAKVNRNLQRTDRQIRKIVFDFNPDNRPNTSDDYGVCRNLAGFILEQQA